MWTKENFTLIFLAIITLILVLGAILYFLLIVLQSVWIHINRIWINYHNYYGLSYYKLFMWKLKSVALYPSVKIP